MYSHPLFIHRFSVSNCNEKPTSRCSTTGQCCTSKSKGPSRSLHEDSSSVELAGKSSLKRDEQSVITVGVTSFKYGLKYGKYQTFAKHTLSVAVCKRGARFNKRDLSAIDFLVHVPALELLPRLFARRKRQFQPLVSRFSR